MYRGVREDRRGRLDWRGEGIIHGDNILLSWKSPRLTNSRLLKGPITEFSKKLKRTRNIYLISIGKLAGEGGGGVRNEGGETGRGRNMVSFHSISNRSRNSRVEG